MKHLKRLTFPGVIALCMAFIGLLAVLIGPAPVHGSAAAGPLASEHCGPPRVSSEIGRAVNVRSGPGTSFNVIGALSPEDSLPIIGRHGALEWWQVGLTGDAEGWVAASVTVADGNIYLVPITDGPIGSAATWDPAADLDCPTDPDGDLEEPEVTEEILAGEWATPDNLSNSGGASEPRFFEDGNGRFHALWLDEVDGFIYTNGDGNSWSELEVIEPPFGNRSAYPDLKETQETPRFPPQLIVDAEGRLHALWIETEEVEGLFYSSVAPAELADFQAWSARVELADAALNLAMTLDDDGTIHLIYIKNSDEEEAPAGLYYRRLVADQEEWSEPVELYASRYYRTLEPDETRLTLKSNGAGEALQLFIAWDNRPLGRVLFKRSLDGGETWEENVVVDGRETNDGPDAVSPSHITLGAVENRLVLTWRAGHGEAECSQFYSWSVDSGESWQPRENFADPVGCHVDNQFFVDDDGLLLLMAQIEDVTETTQMYLLAWDGTRWSLPRSQKTLASFQNPETNLEVALRCHQRYVREGSELFILGCEDEGGADIWFTMSPLASPADWFPEPTTWSSPTSVGESSDRPTALALQADGQGALHVVWSREDRSAIYYTNWDGARWSQSAPIARLPGGLSEQPSLALDGKGRLLLVWVDAQTGQPYFSTADSSQALLPADWSPPQELPVNDLAARSPDITADETGAIHVVFASPLNEGRGLYLTSSTDGGSSWSEVVQIFDARAADWARIDEPTVAVLPDGQMHAMVARFTQPLEGALQGYYYLRSSDWGATWSEPEVVARQPAGWATLATFGDRLIQRLWLLDDGDSSTITIEESLDGGETWSVPNSTSGFADSGSQTRVLVDGLGFLHLLGVQGSQLQHWIWSAGRWLTQDEAFLGSETINQVETMAAAFDGREGLTVVYTGADEEGLFEGIYFSRRTVDEAAGEVILLPELTPTPMPTATPAPSPTPGPTATPVFPTSDPRGSGLSGLVRSGNPAVRLIVAFAPVGLVLLALVALGLRVYTPWRRR